MLAMAQFKQAKLTPDMIFKNQKRFSEKLHKRALKAIKDISEYYDKFVIKDNRDETFLFNQVNYYYQELTHIIFNLRQILIDIGKKNTPSVLNLEKVLDQLNIHTFSIQETLKLEPKELKSKLIDIVVKVGYQFEKLMEIITLNDLHEHKQRILDCQLDFVIYTEKLKLNQQYRNVSAPELQKCILEFNDNLLTILDQIKTGYEVMEEEFSHYVHINMLHLQYIVDYVYLLINSGRLIGKVNEFFKYTEKLGRTFIDGAVNSIDCDNPIHKFAGFFENAHDPIQSGVCELQKGLHEIDQQHFDLQELLAYVVIYGINGLQSLNKTIMDIATLKK